MALQTNKWELKLHEKVEDPYYELTNGPISLVANCGFVGETEEDEDAIFKKVADTLNESGIDFRSNNKLELDQHIEIMKLQGERDDWKAKYDELKAENERITEELRQANLSFKSVRYSLDQRDKDLATLQQQHEQLKERAETLWSTLRHISDSYSEEWTDHNNKMVADALSSWKEGEQNPAEKFCEWCGNHLSINEAGECSSCFRKPGEHPNN